MHHLSLVILSHLANSSIFEINISSCYCSLELVFRLVIVAGNYLHNLFLCSSC